MPPEAVEEVSALDGSERAAGNAARRARAWICHARGEFDFIRFAVPFCANNTLLTII